MINLLAGARAKTNWAQEHYFSIRKTIHEYFESKPYSGTREIDFETGDVVFRAKVLKPLPAVLPLLIGDFVHNLRAAVDHVAYRLVATSGAVPDRQTQFPLCKTEHAFYPTRNTLGHCPTCGKGLGKERPGDLARKLHGVTDETIIKSVVRWQPFSWVEPDGKERPDLAPLHTLNELDAIDKHHGLLVVGSAMLDSTIQVLTWGPNLDPRRLGALYPKKRIAMEDGTELLRIPPIPFPAQVQPKFTYEVCLAIGGKLAPLVRESPEQGLLQTLLAWVDAFVRDFGQFFPPDPA